MTKKDPIITSLATKLPIPNIKSTNNVFHDLISCVIEQQIHYRSTKKQFQKLLDKANLKQLTPTNFEQFETLGLSNAKLSNRKYQTIANF